MRLQIRWLKEPVEAGGPLSTPDTPSGADVASE